MLDQQADWLQVIMQSSTGLLAPKAVLCFRSVPLSDGKRQHVLKIECSRARQRLALAANVGLSTIISLIAMLTGRFAKVLSVGYHARSGSPPEQGARHTIFASRKDVLVFYSVQI